MNIEPPTNPPTDGAHRSEPPLEQRAKAVFDDSVATLAPEVTERLARARAAAVAEAARPRRISHGAWLRRLSGRWLALPRSTQWVTMGMAGGVAALSAILVVLRVSPLPGLPATQFAAGQGLGAEDVEFVAAMNTAGDDIEMLQDLEFYSWLEPAAENGGSDENIG